MQFIDIYHASNKSKFFRVEFSRPPTLEHLESLRKTETLFAKCATSPQTFSAGFCLFVFISLLVVPFNLSILLISLLVVPFNLSMYPVS